MQLKARGKPPRWKNESEERRRRPNQLILWLLIATSRRRGQQLKALADELGTTYSMLDKWRRGHAQISTSSEANQRAIAKYLDIPRALVLFLSEALGIKDFNWPEAEKEILESALGPSSSSTRAQPAELEYDVPGAIARVKEFVDLISGGNPDQHAQHALAKRWLASVEVMLVEDSFGAETWVGIATDCLAG